MQLTPSARIMAILNLSPDSFSDGGKFSTLEAALKQVEKMISEGADIIDVGGESTRPGAITIPLKTELDRVLPVIQSIKKNFDVRISVDTTKFEVAEAVLELGATIINDVSGGADIRLPKLLNSYPDAEVILMHRKGIPETMQLNPQYPDGVVAEVKRYLESRIRAFREFGVVKSRVWVDPGVGFGKNVNHNLDLLRHLSQFANVGGQLVIGTSRKSFLSRVLGQENCPMEEREAGTLATNLWALEHGATVLRVHEVGAMKRAVATWEAIRNGSF